MPTDIYDDNEPGLTCPLEYGFAITPNDTDSLSNVTREIYVGSGGDIALELKNGDSITLKNVPEGARLPYRVAKVLDTDTTASDLVGLY